MNILKNTFTYLLWSLLAVLLGMLYMRLVIGKMPAEESYTGFGVLLRMFLTHSILFVGSGIGVIIALLFIGIDICFLKKKLENNTKKVIIRVAVLLAITVFVAIVHYILEKVIDVI